MFAAGGEAGAVAEANFYGVSEGEGGGMRKYVFNPLTGQIGKVGDKNLFPKRQVVLVIVFLIILPVIGLIVLLGAVR